MRKERSGCGRDTRFGFILPFLEQFLEKSVAFHKGLGKWRLCNSLEDNAQARHPRLSGFTLPQQTVVASQDCAKRPHELTELRSDPAFHPQPGHQQLLQTASSWLKHSKALSHTNALSSVPPALITTWIPSEVSLILGKRRNGAGKLPTGAPSHP